MVIRISGEEYRAIRKEALDKISNWWNGYGNLSPFRDRKSVQRAMANARKAYQHGIPRAGLAGPF